MSRLGRARFWLGAAGAGAVLCAVSMAALLRSCELRRAAACAVIPSVHPQVAQLRADWMAVHPRRAMR